MAQFKIGDVVNAIGRYYVSVDRDRIIVSFHGYERIYAQLDKYIGDYKYFYLEDLELAYPVIQYDPNQNGDEDDDI